MSTQLRRLRYHVAEDPEVAEEVTARSAGTFRGPTPAEFDDVAAPSFNSDEAAARYYLEQLLGRDDRPAMRSIIESERPERVPGLQLIGAQDARATGTRLVHFRQTHRNVPIFGAKAVVELTEGRDLVSVDGRLDEVSNVDRAESLSRVEAVDRVAEFTGVTIPAEAGSSAELNFFKDTSEDESRAWHLVWFLKDLPAAPPGADDPGTLGGHGLGPRPVRPRYNYLVDAHDGEILFFYSSTPTMLDTPTRCQGIDEEDAPQSFFGRIEGTVFHMSDPLRRVRTFDLHLADLVTNPPVPDQPVEGSGNDWRDTNRAAVSAHVNATRVHDFYKSVLQRDGIDDRGMDLISLVNCTYSRHQPPPDWRNAVWMDRKMWYGQVHEGGRQVSLARHLDVIAHELTHGVVEFTSGLVYKNQSGALNESFADIFGIVIKNWYLAPDRENVDTWNWELGTGLGARGLPLRDLSNPPRTGHPQHMNEFVHTTADQGGVHTNSSIHNKAAYHLLTLASRESTRVFSVQDAAVLLYLGMARLAPLADFSDALQAVVHVAETFYGGAADRKEKVAAVRQAYGLVGIQ